VSSESLIDLAGAVAKVVGSSTPVSAVSDSVALVGEGVRDGYQVRLPNSGGQWAVNFDRPLLDVQTAGPTPEGVTQTVDRLVREINQVLVQIQTDARASKDQFVTTTLNPATPPLFYSGVSKVRAVGGCLLLGISATFLMAEWVARRQKARWHVKT
jgi:hypothetical protein